MKNLPHIQKTPQSEQEWLQTLVDLARYLRSPEGCPWDRKQTTASFAQFAREEAAELVDACGQEDNAEIEEEWGDTLFTLLACAAAAEAEGRFQILGALEKAHAKMIRRHAHIFGGHVAHTPEDAAEVWNKIKEQERREKKKT